VTRSTGAPSIKGTAPRPIFCITKSVHNDRALAEAVCEGRFTHIGVTVDLGHDLDWFHADLPADEEWRIEWSKFYYGLDLANAFRDAANDRFLYTWERIVSSWIEQVSIESDTGDVAARRMQNWTYAWSIFASAPGFLGLRDGLDIEILASIDAHAGYVRERLTAESWRNHRTFELYSLFIVALAFPQIDPEGALLDFSIGELSGNLVEGFWPDGVHRENSTHYHMVVLRSLLGMRENARRFALVLPPEFDGHLERACEFALHCLRPDGLIPALSDADSAAYPEVLSLAASLLDRPDFRYAATRGRQGRPPDRRSVSFPEGGYFVQRSGWGTDGSSFDDESYLIFDCGPLGHGGHGHYDLLNVEVFAHSRPLLVDPGRYTYSEDGQNLRRWFKSTKAHNTVTVDGADQTPYRRGQPGKHVATGAFIGRKSAPGFDVLEGRVDSPCYDAIHTRRVFFIADEYWLIEDRLSADREHRYDLRWHLSPDAQGSTELLDGDRETVVLAPGLALVVAGAAGAQLEPGWISPRYGVKRSAPVVDVFAHAADASFLTVVSPLTHGRAAPRLNVTSVGSPSPQATIASVETTNDSGVARDTVAWSAQRADFRLGSLACSATASWLRQTSSGEPVSLRAFDVADAEFPDHGDTFSGPGGLVGWDAQMPAAELVK
jgi:uncharacterized heparinase superfamily protein